MAKSNGKTVLVVDDRDDVRGALATFLEDGGFIVTQVAGVNEAKTYLKSHTPDLVLTDGEMADGSGLHLIAWMRKQEKNIPTILTSGKPLDLLAAQDGIKDAYAEVQQSGGVDNFMPKPVKPAELAARVKLLLHMPLVDKGPGAGFGGGRG